MDRYRIVRVTWLALAVFTFTSRAQTNSPVVQFGEKYTLYSKLLNENREYWVYLPPSYKPDRYYAPQKNPLLFLLDGDWNFGWACQVAQFMGDTLKVPELIVVAIPNTDRERDLTPTHATNIVSSGGGPVFERFLAEELRPAVDAKFRTAPYRLLVGHSLGGALAIDSFLRQTSGFDAYIAIDPSLWWDNRVQVQRAKEFAPMKNSHSALFLAEANWPQNLYDATNSNKYASDLFLSALRTKAAPGIRVGSQFLEAEDHGSSRLMALYEGLRFTFENYKPTNIYALDRAVLVEEHFRKVSDCLGFQILPPERYVNQIGNALSSPTNVDKAIELFKLNVRNYPASASAYRHLADAYLVKGEKELAIQNYKKALDLNPDLDEARKALAKLK